MLKGTSKMLKYSNSSTMNKLLLSLLIIITFSQRQKYEYRAQPLLK